ncbi:MAG: DUF1501 domain-containing protein [Planctomycetota bacterium]|nr:DUF1501 domain-containing protein [Planctomycetota bacterium]
MKNATTVSIRPDCRGHDSRRTFLADIGLGFTGLALGAMLQRDRAASAEEHSVWRPPSGQPHFVPQAKNVIWIFLSGGYSQIETFDPKPELNKYAGKSYDETAYANPLQDPLFQLRSRAVVGGDRLHSRIFPMQIGSRRHGESGIEITDWWPHLATCVDDMAFVRSMYTTDNDHNAEFQMHHGRHKLDPPQPVIGSWINYGLGSLNDNLPSFVFLGQYKDTRVRWNFDADYLGPAYAGVELALDPKNPLPFGNRADGVLAEEQRNQFEFIKQLNQLNALEYPEDEQVRARIKSYELAFNMQMSVPDALRLDDETADTKRLYGIDDETTAVYGRRLLAARRLAERGVRFTLAYVSDYGEWDSHTNLQQNHARSCARVDKPVAGLLKDLKRRGMWDDTVVVFCTEFGRTPGVEIRDAYKEFTGRDHHPHGFTVWFAGAGIKQGVVHGRTDELGFHAVESPHYVTDMHATLLHLLGIDPHQLDVPGRKRLEIDYGNPIHDILV